MVLICALIKKGEHWFLQTKNDIEKIASFLLNTVSSKMKVKNRGKRK
jgi:hypothetical protein